MSYIKASDFEKKKKPIPEKKEVDISPYSAQKIAEAAVEILKNHQPTWQRPAFGVYQASQQSLKEGNQSADQLRSIRKVVSQGKEALKHDDSPTYNRKTVQSFINFHNRSSCGGYISHKAAKNIHALLKFWRGK